ncbi:MAG: 2-pyrone-4,6-dicarboxylate hydrolase [Gammaproteobacteria bacterium]|nr:2-pyrone-4,6-dicarboxylate hydrolase [Gammaproteobacteria bacterium]
MTGIAAAAVPRPVSKPSHPLPAGACDTHSHVFGPFDRFPLFAGRRYTPPLAPVGDYLSMLDRIGARHGVLVHPSASGWDCSCTLDALAVAGGRLRGIVVVPPDVDGDTLESMHSSGIRGIRFTESADGPLAPRADGVLPLGDLAHFAPTLRTLKWHAQVWAKCDAIVAAAHELLRYDIPIVIDHMGFFDSLRGVDDATFRSFLSLVREGPFWVKLNPCRVSKQRPDYADARPFHEALVRAAPDRMVWGSDWPYIGLDPSPPDVGSMVDVFDAFTHDARLRTQILVQNPTVLYGFQNVL